MVCVPLLFSERMRGRRCEQDQDGKGCPPPPPPLGVFLLLIFAYLLINSYVWVCIRHPCVNSRTQFGNCQHKARYPPGAERLSHQDCQASAGVFGASSAAADGSQVMAVSFTASAAGVPPAVSPAVTSVEASPPPAMAVSGAATEVPPSPARSLQAEALPAPGTLPDSDPGSRQGTVRARLFCSAGGHRVQPPFVVSGIPPWAVSPTPSARGACPRWSEPYKDTSRSDGSALGALVTQHFCTQTGGSSLMHYQC